MVRRTVPSRRVRATEEHVENPVGANVPQVLPAIPGHSAHEAVTCRCLHVRLRGERTECPTTDSRIRAQHPVEDADPAGQLLVRREPFPTQ